MVPSSLGSGLLEIQGSGFRVSGTDVWIGAEGWRVETRFEGQIIYIYIYIYKLYIFLYLYICMCMYMYMYMYICIYV